MKTKLLLVSSMLGLALVSTAQITINRSDIGTLVGKSIISADDSVNLNLLSPGNAGANQTWDLTGIGTNYKDTAQFISPTGTSCFSNFSNATLVQKMAGMYAYVLDNSTVIEMLGFCGVFSPPYVTVATYTPPQKNITFPSTYNTAFSSQTKYVMKFTSNSPPVDSSKVVVHISYSSVMDGWGTVTTPSGTFPALRQKIITYETDSSFYHMSGAWYSNGITKDTTIDYGWLSQNNPFIADIKTKWNGQIKSATYWLSSVTAGVAEIQGNTDVSVFPNPSYGEFTVTAGSGQSGLNKMEIYNVMGEKVYSSQISNPISHFFLDLPKGMYFMELSNEQSRQTKKIIIQ